MRRYYYRDEYTRRRFNGLDIGYGIGVILGKILLFGGGFAIGQIFRGVLAAFGIHLPSIF